jgi:hypothetical protein
MTLQELQKQALQLPTDKRWQLVQTLLESLKQESYSVQSHYEDRFSRKP